MRTRFSSSILALACKTSLVVQAQVPLTPLWEHVDPYGAGSWYPVSDIRSTRVTFDSTSGRIYRSIMGTAWGGFYHVQVFDTVGNDLTPTPSVTLHGIDGDNDGLMTQVIRLTAVNDTLAAIVRYGLISGGTSGGLFNWLKVLGTDGSPYFLLGSGPIAMSDFHRDGQSTLVLTNDELYRYGPTNWPDGSIVVPQALGMAVLGNDVVLGPPPSLTHIDRSNLTALAPITVPSSGAATSSICIANGSSSFNYAALNSNGIMDVGLADVNLGPIWNTTITIPAPAFPTAYHVDEQGDFWIAVVQNGTGLLYRFRFLGGSYGVNSYSRRIDGIANDSSWLFLTGRVAGSSSNTYLAAFDTDLITDVASPEANPFCFYPNPANSQLRVDGLAPGTTRLIVTDATGRNVLELNGPFAGSIDITVAELPNGTYLLRSASGAGVVARPFTVLH